MLGSIIVTIIGIAILVLTFFAIFVMPIVLLITQKGSMEQEARMSESADYEEDTWPPAPTTFDEIDQEYAWCCICQRTSKMARLVARGGRCTYDDCPGTIKDMVFWADLRTVHSGLPAEPVRETVYTNLMNEADRQLISEGKTPTGDSPPDISAN